MTDVAEIQAQIYRTPEPVFLCHFLPGTSGEFYLISLNIIIPFINI